MMYCSDIKGDNYIIYDTDDCTYNSLTKGQVLTLNSKQRIIGVSGNEVRKVDLVKLINRWKILGTLEQNLDTDTINKIFSNKLYEFSIRQNTISLRRYLGVNKNIVIPNFVDELGESCFNSNRNITNVIIPDSVQKIDNYCFSDCTSLETVKMSNSIKSLGWGAFLGCVNLKEIELSNNIINISSYCFCGCRDLKKNKYT